MQTPKRSPAEIAMEAFVRSVGLRKAALGIKTDREIFKMVAAKFKQGAVKEKTVNNALNGRHDAKIGTLNAIAEALGLPLWVFLIPDVPEEFLTDKDKDRLVRLVNHYISSHGEGRAHIENIAAAAAYQSKKTAA